MAEIDENMGELDDYFMAVAYLSAKHSKDPNTKVGACIVDADGRVVGMGYNKMPNGCEGKFPWDRETESKDDDPELRTKYIYVCHAELNAISNKTSADVRGCKIYVSLFPCNECAKAIIQSGIKEVIYGSDKYKDNVKFKASRLMLEGASVPYRQFTPKQIQYKINFDPAKKIENW